MKTAMMKAKHFAHEWPEDYWRTVQQRVKDDPLTAFTCENGCQLCAIIEEGPCSVAAWRRANADSSA